MSDEHFDPVQFGQMIAVMRQLERTMDATNGTMKGLDERLSVVESRFNVGWAGLVGLLVGLGFAIVGVKETFTTLLKGWL